jgi:diguanylate cyclase (GGDEF)-like protein/PAS domain S-box-containing protein
VTKTATRRTRLLLIEADDGDAALWTTVEEAAPGAYDVVGSTLDEAASILQSASADCAVIDLGHAGDDGVGILDSLTSLGPTVALIGLTDGNDDVDVTSIRSSAHTCVRKTSFRGDLLVLSIREAIRRKRLETSLAETQSIAQVGTWELDLSTNGVLWSDELCRIFAFAVDETPTYDALIGRVHPDDRPAVLETISAMLEATSTFFIEHRIVLPDGAERWMRSKGRIELDPMGAPERLVGLARDISEHRAADDALFRQAFHDPLTGLPNRDLFRDRTSQALNRLSRQPSMVGVFYLDIDQFKRINDSLGQSVGDQLLLSLAARLAHLARQEDTLGHIGADEFVMLCEGLNDEAEAIGVADRIGAAMTEPLRWDDGQVVMSVSIGIALATSSSVEANSLIRDADAAMHGAKTSGRARSVVFAETMRTSAVGILDTEMALRESILKGDLRLHYQPIVTLTDGTVLGHEALVRWEHPTRGLIAPDQFIPIAEETGLIVPLGAWVLREACLQARRFQQQDPRWSELTMSVNLSGGQLGQPDLIDLILETLRDADLRPEHLQLEMTESVLMDDAATTITILQTLKGLDVRLAVDDFGTGYSSLAYLRRFPVDVLKIDRSFVDGLGDDLEDTAIVAAVVSLADTLGLTTIAEGVETVLQRDCLVSLGCARAQGYLYARPRSATDAARALDSAAELHPGERSSAEKASERAF